MRNLAGQCYNQAAKSPPGAHLFAQQQLARLEARRRQSCRNQQPFRLRCRARHVKNRRASWSSKWISSLPPRLRGCYCTAFDDCQPASQPVRQAKATNINRAGLTLVEQLAMSCFPLADGCWRCFDVFYRPTNKICANNETG